MTLLLLAGTGEGRAAAKALAAAGVPAVASLAGGTRAPADLALPTRRGGFGGAAGFEAYLDQERITAVLDATHPFAIDMTRRTAAICAARALPYAQILRPPWAPAAADRWHPVADEAAAVALIPEGATVFLATGPQGVHRFAGLRGRIYCRRIDPPLAPFPFENGDWCVGRPPFAVAEEVALFQRLDIDWLVTKNAGGQGAWSKLEAARQLSLPVAMIDRPAQPQVLRFETVAEAVDWAKEPWLDGS